MLSGSNGPPASKRCTSWMRCTHGRAAFQHQRLITLLREKIARHQARRPGADDDRPMLQRLRAVRRQDKRRLGVAIDLQIAMLAACLRHESIFILARGDFRGVDEMQRVLDAGIEAFAQDPPALELRRRDAEHARRWPGKADSGSSMLRRRLAMRSGMLGSHASRRLRAELHVNFMCGYSVPLKHYDYRAGVYSPTVRYESKANRSILMKRLLGWPSSRSSASAPPSFFPASAAAGSEDILPQGRAQSRHASALERRSRRFPVRHRQRPHRRASARKSSRKPSRS